MTKILILSVFSLFNISFSLILQRHPSAIREQYSTEDSPGLRGPGLPTDPTNGGSRPSTPLYLPHHQHLHHGNPRPCRHDRRADQQEVRGSIRYRVLVVQEEVPFSR